VQAQSARFTPSGRCGRPGGVPPWTRPPILGLVIARAVNILA
jgi:hypothetical protein